MSKKPKAIDRVHQALFEHQRDNKKPVSIIVTCAFDMLLRREHGAGQSYFQFGPDWQTLLGLPYVVIHDLPEDFKIGV